MGNAQLSEKSMLPGGAASTTLLLGVRWLRHVVANLNADIILLLDAICQALSDARAATQIRLTTHGVVV